MVVPTTITMASAYRALSNDYASWESLKDAVGISYNDVNGLYNDYWMPMVENFFAEMADRDNLCLSMQEYRTKPGEKAKHDLNEKTTYRFGNRSFIVEPVFKEETQNTLGCVLLRLMKSESAGA